MEKILNWFTKEKMLVASLLFAALYPLSRYLIKTDSVLCLNIGQGEKFVYWVTTCNFATVLSFIAIGVALFSLLFLFLKKEAIYNYWRKYTFIYLAIYLFFTIITPWYEGDGFLSIGKDLVAIVLTLLYSIISVIIIVNHALKKNS